MPDGARRLRTLTSRSPRFPAVTAVASGSFYVLRAPQLQYTWSRASFYSPRPSLLSLGPHGDDTPMCPGLDSPSPPKPGPATLLSRTVQAWPTPGSWPDLSPLSTQTPSRGLRSALCEVRAMTAGRQRLYTGLPQARGHTAIRERASCERRGTRHQGPGTRHGNRCGGHCWMNSLDPNRPCTAPQMFPRSHRVPASQWHPQHMGPAHVCQQPSC